MVKYIDINKWKRRVPYENFIRYTNPMFSLATRLDVTELYLSSKRRGTSFFSDFMFLAAKCLNAVDELRLRIIDGRVAVYDVIDPNYIVMNNDGVICSCRTKMSDDYEDFYARSRRDIEAVRMSKSEGEFNSSDNGVFYISCLKWTDIISFANPFDYADAAGSSIPRLTWSKVVDECGRKKMTFDIAAHHALTDGEPICRAFNSIQEAIDKADEFLGVKEV